MKLLKKILLSIATILSLLVYLLLFASIFEPMKKDVKSCNHRSINNFDVTICRDREGKEPIKLVSYDFNQERLITLTGRNTFDENQTAFLKKTLQESLGEPNKIERIKIVAHSTLIALQNTQERRLGQKRAEKIKAIIKELGYGRVPISTSYSRDPFLDQVNRQVNGTLLSILELQGDIRVLKDDLNISKNDTTDKMHKRLQKEGTLLKAHIQQLEPYGSTVIIISLKT